jgi:hypothetical protein
MLFKTIFSAAWATNGAARTKSPNDNPDNNPAGAGIRFARLFDMTSSLIVCCGSRLGDAGARSSVAHTANQPVSNITISKTVPAGH